MHHTISDILICVYHMDRIAADASHTTRRLLTGQVDADLDVACAANASGILREFRCASELGPSAIHPALLASLSAHIRQHGLRGKRNTCQHGRPGKRSTSSHSNCSQHGFLFARLFCAREGDEKHTAVPALALHLRSSSGAARWGASCSRRVPRQWRRTRQPCRRAACGRRIAPLGAGRAWRHRRACCGTR